MRCCVDTQTLIWYIRRPGVGSPTSVTAEQSMRAHILMDLLDEQRADIVVPSVIVSELLVPIPKTSRSKFLAEFTAT